MVNWDCNSVLQIREYLAMCFMRLSTFRTGRMLLIVGSYYLSLSCFPVWLFPCISLSSF